jgi:hypothetical protein
LRKDKSVKRSSMVFVIYATHTLRWRIRIALIVRIRDVYFGVDDRYIVLVFAVKASNPGLELGHWIGDLVVSKITVQVIDVQVVPVASQSRVPIDCVAAVSGVERLCIVCPQTEIMDVFREPVDVVVLLRGVSLAQ